MNADLSVAPEIALLTQRRSVDPVPQPGTLGDHADELTRLAATPQRWWDLVRFDPAAPVRIMLGPGAWLLVVPPSLAADCDCRLATLLAGEAAESGRQLRAGRTLVHGANSDRHVIRSGGAGYAVSLHTSVTSNGGYGNHPAG